MAKKSNGDRRVKLGVVGVDSGQLLICDPCYLTSAEQLSDKDLLKDKEDSVDYSPTQSAQLQFDNGNDGAGIIFHSGLGDGLYEVWATIGNVQDFGTLSRKSRKSERIKSVEIRLI